ncbi:MULTISPECIES: M24 family metallopeptidase [Eubacteriales]|uniref:M24 family metallopeptidase n=1 Tax=Eubacteriales TaxID=186802 RepID=UPI000822082D|nr:Xaa-Pro peptidase family protein [Muriventricola aceti]MCU6703337.1 Xaa-Pro peptidase family protein [Muriventricola aceti]SCJ43612.1 Uncharacterized peptidase SA1530 [uncultured Flavonifractor sp.]
MTINEIKEQLKQYDRKQLYREKVIKMQKAMAEQGIDGIICFKPQNTFFLSGFNPILYSHPVVVVIPQEGNAVLLVHSLRARHSADEAAIEDIRLFGMWANQKPIANDAYSAIDIIVSDLRMKGKVLGYEGDFISLSQYQKLQDITQATKMVDVSDFLKRSRNIKDEYEINLLRLSSYLTNVGMEAALANIRKSEAEASIAAEIAMRETWAKELSEFEISSFGNTEGGIVTALWCYSNSGYRVPYGCECPSNRVPQEGEVCLPVCWAAIDGYHSENERTVMIGKIPERYERAYDAMLAGRQNVFQMMKAGVAVSDVYAAGVAPYIEAGFGDYLPGRIGHGLGLSLHEFPSLSKDSSLVLEEGMVVTVEPGLVFAGWGSTRHSDTVVVRKDGIEILTCSPEERLVR